MTARTIVWRRVGGAAAMLLGCGTAFGLWGWTHHRVDTHIYSDSEFGGYVGANRKRLPDTPLQRASDAYAAGRYREAEQIANEVIQADTLRPLTRQSSLRQRFRPPTPQSWGTHDAGREARLEGSNAESLSPSHPLTPSPPQALLARRILAYSSARQGRYAEAKARFAELRQAAYESPEHGRQRVALGDVAPTLEEEGAFQEAVCTSALGDKRGAEAELDGFMRSYPRSVLVHAAVKRIGRMHGGDVPKDAEGFWKQAMAVQKAADEADRKADALCGPECLAELLRRDASRKGAKMQRDAKSFARGDAETRSVASRQPVTNDQQLATVEALAAEMHTTGEGSSVAAMQAAAARHGLKLQGVSMTTKGLARQRLPLIALVAPGHYVLVESLAHAPASPLVPTAITVWDPDAKRTGVAGRRTYSAAEWEKAWNGVALR